MMSICLQSMVDELMVKKSGGSIKKVCVKKSQILQTAMLFLINQQNDHMTLLNVFTFNIQISRGW